MKTVLLISVCIIGLTKIQARDEEDSEEDAEITITTAMILDQTFAKPTSLYRRIDVERNVEDKRNTPLDLFRLRRHNKPKKKSNDDVWNWDFWCQLQPKTGNCSDRIKRFYYDTQLDQCLEFMYSGCNGNKNRFDKIIDCERHCKGAAHMRIKASTDLAFCELQFDAGDCLGFLRQYHYDVNKDGCAVFMYGGCGGNQNRFDTKRKCLRYCSKNNYDMYDDLEK